ncbi:unnamed protein product [Timema podura]|uniref:Uncharacterized protein n=1 Tax=Timema podura TaxID=61482 RepID=A0ABN7NDH7_TIMPD|nr:unnamed protein product [Timema podura]
MRLTAGGFVILIVILAGIAQSRAQVMERCANQRAARGRVLPASTTSNYSLQRHHGTTPIRTRRHQALEVIREEAVNEVCYTKRRKQLIPRARLAHWRAPSSTDSRRSSICSTQKRTEGKPCSQPTEIRQPGNDIPENSYAEIELLEVPPAFRDETETNNIQHSESGTKPVNPGSSDLKTEHKSTESFKEAEKSFTYLRERKTVNLTSAAKNKQSFISNLNSSKIPSLKGNIEIIVDDRSKELTKGKESITEDIKINVSPKEIYKKNESTGYNRVLKNNRTYQLSKEKTILRGIKNRNVSTISKELEVNSDNDKVFNAINNEIIFPEKRSFNVLHFQKSQNKKSKEANITNVTKIKRNDRESANIEGTRDSSEGIDKKPRCANTSCSDNTNISNQYVLPALNLGVLVKKTAGHNKIHQSPENTFCSAASLQKENKKKEKVYDKNNTVVEKNESFNVESKLVPSSKLQYIPKIEDTNERTREENLPIVTYKNNEREMSRRPQILYIIDSTSSKSVANQIKNPKKQNKTDEEILKTQEDNHVTSKLRTLFEENSNTIKITQTRNPQITIGLNSVQTITEGDRKQYLHDEPNTCGESEEHFKPRIYATLSVEDVDTVSKETNHKMVSHSPLHKSCSFLDAVKRKSPPMEKTHIPAFRAFSCSGQKGESQNDLPISRIVRAKISSESEIFDQSHSISKASTKKGYQTLEMSKVNVNEGIKLDEEYIHKKEKQMLHKDTSESTKARALKSRKYSPDNKAAAFDGLLQYLQDYRHGLRELLVNNNVVIIEPIREHSGRMEHCSNHKIDGFANNGKANEPSNEKTCRITGATVKKSYSNENKDVSAMFSSTLPRQQKFQQPVLRRHFFYHPKRTNRELVDEELPNPDTVKNARQVFEKSLYHKGSGSDSGNNSSERNKPNSNLHEGTLNKIDKRRQIRYLTADTIPPQSLVLPRWTDTGSVSSGVSSDLSYDPDIDLSSPRGNILSRNSNHHYDNLDVFSSDDNDNSEEKRNCYSDDEDDDGDAGGHYVPPEVLDKIRACGTSVTYYGGHVIASTKGPLMSPMTLAIMDEIRKNNSSTRKKIFRNNYLGVKFRLVKSNSCGSRLELAGTEEGDKYQSEMEKVSVSDKNVRQNCLDDENNSKVIEEQKNKNADGIENEGGKKLHEAIFKKHHSAVNNVLVYEHQANINETGSKTKKSYSSSSEEDCCLSFVRPKINNLNEKIKNTVKDDIGVKMNKSKSTHTWQDCSKPRDDSGMYILSLYDKAPVKIPTINDIEFEEFEVFDENTKLYTEDVKEENVTELNKEVPLCKTEIICTETKQNNNTDMSEGSPKNQRINNDKIQEDNDRNGVQMTTWAKQIRFVEDKAL